MQVKSYNPDGTQQIDTYNITLTVSGLNKKTAIPYLLEKYKTNDNVFKHFTQGLEVPPPFSGRMVSYYIDDDTTGDIVDYLGNRYTPAERSSVALENTSYTMDYSDSYERYKAYIDSWVGIHDPEQELEKRLKIE